MFTRVVVDLFIYLFIHLWGVDWGLLFSLDNSEWMRNGDYLPTRLEAQQDAGILTVKLSIAHVIAVVIVIPVAMNCFVGDNAIIM
jgi:hypothetical protein